MLRFPARPTALLLLAIAVLIGAAPGSAQSPVTDIAARIDPAVLRDHVYALSVEIGTRPAGSEAEARAAAYIAEQLTGWGYTVDMQEFVTARGTAPITTCNVIAQRPATLPDEAGGRIIVGAHMDSVTAGAGADDNASGVAVMLAVAEAVADLETVRPITFVAFGAEEIGLRGSTHYLASLTQLEIAEIQVMVNVDTVGAGDHFYVYAGAMTESQSFSTPYTPGPTWARDLALRLGAALGHAVQTTPPDSWNGFIGPWSDHQPFADRGIAVAYFERWNWEAGSDPNWGQETASGDILHTSRDVFENVDPALMQPVAETLAAFVAALATGAEPADGALLH